MDEQWVLALRFGVCEEQLQAGVVEGRLEAELDEDVFLLGAGVARVSILERQGSRTPRTRASSGR